MSERQLHREQQSMSMMYGTYADVLFVLFPFLVIGMQRLWDGRLYEMLMHADLSIAAAILAGLAIGKFVLGLVINRDLGRFKERIVFFIALTLFVVLGPAIILILSIISGAEVPGFVAFVQPILLILAISLYSTAVGISNILTRDDSQDAYGSGADGKTVKPGNPARAAHAPLDLPRHTGTDSW
ncbi:hypothetical protein [uncultured Marinobacter sp.]|uniref:hypothetical protein n=1 Tax=uncultured Marinobacter sp. TaxID=187379 RepID=UPI00261EC577|nr:hypothetical protein [uncultured Marinobacter sp.]